MKSTKTKAAAASPSKSSLHEVQNEAVPMETLEDKIQEWLPKQLIPRLASSNVFPDRSWTDVECTVTRPRCTFFVSDLFFANIRFPGEKCSWSCLVKVPAQDPVMRSYQDYPHSFLNETMFYERLAADSADYPKYYLGGKDPELEYVIVLENVIHLRGFLPKSKKLNVELNYVIAGLQAIARFHANTYAVKVKKPDEFNDIVKDIAVVRYRKGPVNEHFKACVDLRMKRVTKILIARNYDSDFRQKMVELFDECFSKVLMRCVEPREPLATIVHGDCTINNMLFRRKQKSQELETMLFDFATLMYCSPATDVSTFIYMSCSRRDIVENHENLFKVYHDCLIVSLKDHGISDLTKYSYDSFWADYREHALFGYVMCVCFLGTMLEYEKNSDLQELQKRVKESNFEGGGEILSQQLVEMLIDMLVASLLDTWM